MRTYSCKPNKLRNVYKLGPSINGLVTYENTKFCCQGFVLALALFQSTTANKIDSEHTRDYTNLFLACKVEILQVITANKIDHLFRFISGDFRLKVPKIAKNGTLVSC